jgi:hypothetical protein
MWLFGRSWRVPVLGVLDVYQQALPGRPCITFVSLSTSAYRCTGRVRRAVQVWGGLVEDDQRWVADERPGQRHALPSGRRTGPGCLTSARETVAAAWAGPAKATWVVKIAQLVGTGLSNKDVAAQCCVSPPTVGFHLRNVFAKVRVCSRGKLARLHFS